jgi:hypothetical protein
VLKSEMKMAEKTIKLVLGGTPGKLVRFSHLNAHTPRQDKFSKEPKLQYSCAFLIPKTNVEDVKAIRAAVADCLKAEFTDKKKPIPPGHWNPLRDGDKDTKEDGTAYGDEVKGHYLINSKTSEDYPPVVVSTTKGADGKLLRIGKADIKSGDWGRAEITLYGYNFKAGGVGAGLNKVQLVQEGESLGGSGGSADDAFGQFEDEDGGVL